MISEILQYIDSVLWNGFLVYIIIITGLFLTIKLKGIQFRYLFKSIKLVFTRHDNKAQGDITQFQSLMTALAATIGIASIAGMATAIISGGFGAIFWMWVVALIGMVTKYAEAILAVKYRQVDKRNQMCGGPMYYIEKGLNQKWLAVLFALFGSLASFAGGNMIQSQSISEAMHELFHMPPIVTGIILALLIAGVVFGGIRSLGKINAVLVPVMAVLYITGGLIILGLNFDKIPAGLYQIVHQAFNGRAVVGGFIGASVMSAIQMGIARGISSNESGLGTAPIAAAAAKTDVPGRQALISMSGVFFSSFVVCTITVLVLAVTNVVGTLDENGQILNGASLVMKAFSLVLPGGQWIVAIGLLLFGFSTILGYSYYGEKCVEYLFGQRLLLYYKILFIIVTFIGALLSINVVWPLADIFNGLMALPNLIGIILLSSIVKSETKAFVSLLREEKSKS
jgi:alanine or glycine:cation symporter, AGCS family